MQASYSYMHSDSGTPGDNEYVGARKILQRGFPPKLHRYAGYHSLLIPVSFHHLPLPLPRYPPPPL